MVNNNDNDVIELVLARLQTMPDYIQINMGNNGILEKSDLIKHVKEQDKLGEKIVEMQMKYLKALSSL